MRTVAFVGFNEQCHSELFDLADDVEIWSVNYAHQYDFPRLDRVFEIHLLEHIKDPNYLTKGTYDQYIQWLSEPHDFSIYMQDHFPEFPASVRYPIVKALELTKGKKYFSNSICYMAALAILEGDIDRVEFHGFTLSRGTEWEYQRDFAYYWHGRLEAAGIDVYVTPDSDLFSEKMLYGYEGAQMVNRQTLEVHKDEYEKQLKLNRVKCNIFKGQLIERARHNGTDQDQREIQQMAEKLSDLQFLTAKAEAAVEVCQNFLDNCDLPEVEPNLTMFEREAL